MYKRFHRLRTVLCLLLTACVAAGLCPLPARGDTLKSAPMTAGATQNGMVRVRLSSLGSPATLNLTVYGSYTVGGQSSQSLGNGTALTVNYDKSSGQLSLTYGGVVHKMGSSFRLCRHETSGQNGIKISQARVPANLYPGDFQFTVKNGILYVIVYVYMEDYLYGVLPYELSDSNPLEALKAQAVASRTYTMRAMNASVSSMYDVVDTTSDQVYSGTPSGNTVCRAAVDATKGIVAKIGTALTATYYTASNGGQTESIKNAWGTTAYAYLGVKDDPYDLSSPEARKTSFFVNASGTQTNTKLGTLLNQKAAASFGAGAQVTGVTAVTPHTPKYASPSRLYTKLSFSVIYTRNGQAGSGVITFDIFNELESPLNMSINSGANELWSVTSTATGFTVTARRYGHGIGMSQRGAIQMARMGYTYDQILAFYFEGCTRVQYTLTRSILSPVVPGQSSQEQVIQEQPAVLDPTPAPAGTTARVNTPSNSLNLRASASTNAKVLLYIPKGSVIPILERGDTWCKTTYAGQTGYVMTQYLVFVGDPTPAPVITPAPAVTPTPTPTPGSSYGSTYARVTTVSGSLNLRANPNSYAAVLRTIPQNEIIPILEQGSVWCKTTYGGYTGYVMTQFLTILSSAPTATPTAAPVVTAVPTAIPSSGDQYARVTTPSGSLNLRGAAWDNAPVITTIPQNDIVVVHSRGTTWCRVTWNGITGFVMTKFLTFQTGATTPAPVITAAPTATPTPFVVPVVPTGEQYARVTTVHGSLNLREAARDNARVITTIPQNDIVLVHSRGSAWCKVTWNGVTGFVMTKFLTFISATGGGQQTAPTATPAPIVTPVPAISADAQRDPTLRTLQTAVLGRVMSTASSLNLRAGCSTNAWIILEIPKYEYVVITAVGDTWCAVEYEGKAGFCMTKYLEFRVYE